MSADEIIDGIHLIPESSKSALKSCLKPVTFPKGYLLLKAGKTEAKMYLIQKGIARAFARNEENEITFWFGIEGDPIVSMRSYVEGKPGYEDIELLEDCELFEIETGSLQNLFATDIHIANWGRKFAEKELIKTEDRLISMQFDSASERYKSLMTRRPELLKRVPLGILASYLGITQVSLSRIRAELR